MRAMKKKEKKKKENKSGPEDSFDSAGFKMNGEGERQKANTRALF